MIGIYTVKKGSCHQPNRGKVVTPGEGGPIKQESKKIKKKRGKKKNSQKYPLPTNGKGSLLRREEVKFSEQKN